jgi:hypothetical protein
MQTLASIAALARVLAPPVLLPLNNFTANTEKTHQKQQTCQKRVCCFSFMHNFPRFFRPIFWQWILGAVYGTFHRDFV